MKNICWCRRGRRIIIWWWWGKGLITLIFLYGFLCDFLSFCKTRELLILIKSLILLFQIQKNLQNIQVVPLKKTWLFFHTRRKILTQKKISLMTQSPASAISPYQKSWSKQPPATIAPAAAPAAASSDLPPPVKNLSLHRWLQPQQWLKVSSPCFLPSVKRDKSVV